MGESYFLRIFIIFAIHLKNYTNIIRAIRIGAHVLTIQFVLLKKKPNWKTFFPLIFLS